MFEGTNIGILMDYSMKLTIPINAVAVGEISVDMYNILAKSISFYLGDRFCQTLVKVEDET